MASGLAALLLFLLPVPASSQGPGDAVDPDILLIERLKDAEDHYDKGIEKFRSGNIRSGRSSLKKAFAIITSSLEEDSLPLELREDFHSMLEKVRTWETGETRTEYATDFEFSEEVLEEATPAAVPERLSRVSRTIEIDPENELTKKFIRLYTQRRPDSVREALERSGRYREMIDAALQKAGLPRELFHLVMTESEYKLNAVSRSGAAGLWQFMPGTARGYGLEVSYWVDERFDPEKATNAAVHHLKDLYQWFGDWHLALAAYNRGLNGIGRDLKFSRSADYGGLSDRKALPRETHNYVPKFMACVLIGENPKEYGIYPKYEKPTPYDVVKLDKDLDLGIAAKCAGTTKKAIQELNPHIRAWCTPKNRANFELRIPKGTTEAFWGKLKKIKNWNPGPQVVRYKVRRGDYLGKIARRYRTTVKSIMRQNKIKNPRLIRPGKTLKIRPGKAFYRKSKKK